MGKKGNKSQKHQQKRSQSNTRKCTSRKDIITQKTFTKKSKIVKFQPDPNIDVYNCYEKKSLSKYVLFKLEDGEELENITDMTTRIPFGLPFLCTHFIEEIFGFIERKMIELLFDMSSYEFPDGRMFTEQLSELMDLIQYYESVWVTVNKTRYTFIKKTIINDIKKTLKMDEETNFQERTLDEVNMYFDFLENHRSQRKNSSRNRSGSRSGSRSNRNV